MSHYARLYLFPLLVVGMIAVAGCNNPVITLQPSDGGVPMPCPEGMVANGSTCEVFWGHVEGMITLEGQTDHAGTMIVLLGTSVVAATTPEGSFTMAPVLAGTYMVEARHEGYLSARFTVTIVDRQAARITGTLQKIPPGESCVVTGSATLLAQRDHSSIVATLTDSSGNARMQLNVNADGTYQFDNVPPGVYQLVFQAPFYGPVTVDNIIVTPGTYRVQPVVLTPGILVSPEFASTVVFTPDSSRAVMALADGAGGESHVEILSLATGTFTSVATDRFSIHAFDATNRYALGGFGADSVLQQLDLDTGTLTPVSPSGAVVLSKTKDTVLYKAASGDLYQVVAGSTQGVLAVAAPCSNTQWAQPQALGLNSTFSEIRRWKRIEARANCGGVGLDAFLLLFDDALMPIGFGSTLLFAPDSLTILVPSFDDPTRQYSDPYTLKQISLSTGQTTVLMTNVPRTFDGRFPAVTLTAQGKGIGYAIHDVDPLTQRGTLVRIDTHSRTAQELLSDMSRLYGSIATTGPNGDLSVVRVDDGVVTPFCPGAATVVPAVGPMWEKPGSPAAIAVCTSAIQPGLTVYDPVTNRTQRVSSALVSDVLVYQQGVVWKEGGVVKGWHTAGTGAVTLCTSLFTNAVPGNGGTKAASVDGRSWTYQCGQEWKLANLATGIIRDVLSPLSGDVFDFTCNASPSGNRAVCSYSAAETSPFYCGDAMCIIAISESSSSVPVSWSNRFAKPEWYMTLWAEDEQGFTGIVRETVSGGTGSGPSPVHAVSFASNPPLIKNVGYPKATLFPPAHGGRYFGRHGETGLSGVGPAVYDFQTGTMSAPLGAGPILRLGSTDEYSVGSVIMNFVTGQVTQIGTIEATRVLSKTQPVMTFVDSSYNLRRYEAGGRLTTLASGMYVSSSSALSPNSLPQSFYWTEANQSRANLAWLDADTGTLTTLAVNVVPVPHKVDATHYYLFGDPDLKPSSGKLLLFNPTTRTVTDLKARSVIPAVLTQGRERVAFTGVDDNGKSSLFVAQLDGSVTHRLGNAGNFRFTPDSERVLFEADGLQWVEGSATADPIAIDRAVFLKDLWLSPNARTLIFTNIDRVAQPSHLGTYQAAIP